MPFHFCADEARMLLMVAPLFGSFLLIINFGYRWLRNKLYSYSNSCSKDCECRETQQ